MHVVVLTGAGVSAESGFPTFRDSDGLWENHEIEDVATPQAWMENPELVWKFNQERRKSMDGIEPNQSHYALAELEKNLNEAGHKFTLITQNIDGLHLMAGSKNVVEMHGTLRTFRCQKCHHTVVGYEHLSNEFLPCEKCEWSMMRPDVVWFHEQPKEPERFMTAVKEATHFAAIGTSGEVWPAAGFINSAHRNEAALYYSNIVDPPPVMLEWGTQYFIGPASVAVPLLCDMLLIQSKNGN